MNRREVEIAILEKLYEIKEIKEEYDGGNYFTLAIIGDSLLINNEYWEDENGVKTETPINVAAKIKNGCIHCFEGDIAELFEMEGDYHV